MILLATRSTGKWREPDGTPGVNVGLISWKPRLDLDYSQDVAADVDMNVMMTSEGRPVPVQETDDPDAADPRALDLLLNVASTGMTELLACQAAVLQA